MNQQAQNSERLLPHLEAITNTCLEILVYSRCREIEDEFKFLAAKFWKNVVMTSDQEHVARLQTFEA